MIQPSRRSLITGLVSFMAAPAIVRAASLMPVKPMLSPEDIAFQSVNEARDRLMIWESTAGGFTGWYRDLFFSGIACYRVNPLGAALIPSSRWREA
jgi:hypothetical protein